ncbi:MAG: phosphoribosylamine--glycine ligase [Methanoregulaceae archaeon]
MRMKVLLVGGGGREHALACALSRGRATDIYAVMPRRNPGISALAKDVLLTRETDVPKIVSFAKESGVDHAVIGPEAPLEAGLVDSLDEIGVGCVGPHRLAARLETDKGFCRDMMKEHGIAGCPLYRVFRDPEDAVLFIQDHKNDLAIKPIGLTGGKGVRIMGEHVDRDGAIAYVRELGGNVVLEERLIGEEFTLQAFVDGSHLVPMPLVQDHKRAYDGDHGPNTGGMGAYTMPDHRLPFVTEADYHAALIIMRSVVSSMKRAGSPYKGILYGQFMNTRDGPKVIEFNARFGDPEAMNVLSLLTSDFGEIVAGIAAGSLSPGAVKFEKFATVCKYLVPDTYPESSEAAGHPVIPGEPGKALLYYANVDEKNGQLLTASSRTLAFVGMGETLDEAERIAERAAAGTRGRVRYRKDIGTSGLLSRRIAHMAEVRK